MLCFILKQVDTWPVNREPYTLDFFIELNKSYIGGNMCMPFFHGFFTKSRTKNDTFKITSWIHNRALNIKGKCYI